VLGRLHYIASYTGQEGAAGMLELVSIALDAGVPCVQLRAKGSSDRQRYEMAARVVALCHQAGATCIINDRVDIACASGADGAHVGDEDLPVDAARRLLGPGLLLGATARTPEAAVRAEAAGASYIGTGPCYPTATKKGLPPPIGVGGLARVTRAVGSPVVAIGGVTAEHVDELIEAGAYGIAVVSAISSAADPASAVRELLAKLTAATVLTGRPA